MSCPPALALLAVLCSCALPRVDVDRPTAGCPDHDAATVADEERRQQLERAMRALAAADRAVPLGTLSPQLERAGSERFAPGTSLGPVLEPDALCAAVRGSVVVVGRRYLCGKCDRWHLSTATGFVAAEGGVVCTSHHVLDGREDTTFGVMTEGGDVLPVVEVLAADRAADVALLRVDGELPPPLPLRPGVRPGATVHVLSHPNAAFYYFSSGVLARRFPFRPEAGRSVEQLDLTADFARGSSGAPVLDAHGAVVGVVRATDSIYYTEQADEQRDLQMVFKRATPIEAVLDLAR
jgi:hypothetical protein